MGALCEQYGVFNVLDACQSAGQVPLDVGRIKCDVPPSIAFADRPYGTRTQASPTTPGFESLGIPPKSWRHRLLGDAMSTPRCSVTHLENGTSKSSMIGTTSSGTLIVLLGTYV